MAKDAFRWLLIGLLSFTQLGYAQVDEYGAKAQLIYNLSRFIEWPESKPQILICVLGRDPFGSQLDRYVDKTVGSARIAVSRLASITEAAPCQVLFIAADRQHEMTTIAASLAARPTLLVSDDLGSLGNGAMIVALVKGGKLRFHIDNTAAKKAGLLINAQVLALAESVR